jgi:hypothetical protein
MPLSFFILLLNASILPTTAYPCLPSNPTLQFLLPAQYRERLPSTSLKNYSLSKRDNPSNHQDIGIPETTRFTPTASSDPAGPVVVSSTVFESVQFRFRALSTQSQPCSLL